MKKLLLALTFIAAGTFAYGQETNPNAAEITFEKETIDYGTIEKGSDASKVVHIKGIVKAPQPVQTTPVKEEKTSMMQESK